MERTIKLTIGELAHLYGVSLRTLRFYEQRGLLTPSRVGASRYYDERDETRLRVILQGKRLGFTIAEIASIIESREALPEQPTETTMVLTRSQIETQIAVLTQRRVNTEAAIRELRAALPDQSAGGSPSPNSPTHDRVPRSMC